MKEWKNILISFSIISFACAIKNYIIYIFNDSSFFAFLAPSVFGTHNFYITPGFINFLYDSQRSIITASHSLVSVFYNDQYHIVSILIIAPFIEETIYRLPLFSIKNYLNDYIYWFFAIIFSAIFAHSHDLYGISLLPLFMLGICCSWIIKVNKVFWPCLALHFLYNFFSFIRIISESIWWGLITIH